VADTGNGRIQKFSSTGAFLTTIGSKGSGHGQLAAPNGIAIDHVGNIYVADAGNHRVLKLAPDGGLLAEWKGPELGFYGPRRIAIADDQSMLSIRDNRIVKFSSDGQVLGLGVAAGEEGQFNDPLPSQLIPILTKFMWPIHVTGESVFDSNGKS
jgi:DNA-binding beta-propeller fold protein YncE